MTYHIPKNVTQISDFDEYVGIYCPEYFFKIPMENKKYKITYLFA